MCRLAPASLIPSSSRFVSGDMMFYSRGEWPSISPVYLRSIDILEAWCSCPRLAPPLSGVLLSLSRWRLFVNFLLVCQFSRSVEVFGFDPLLRFLFSWEYCRSFPGFMCTPCTFFLVQHFLTQSLTSVSRLVFLEKDSSGLTKDPQVQALLLGLLVYFCTVWKSMFSDSLFEA